MTVLKDCSFYIRRGRVGVLLIHGLGGSPEEMRYLANGMARAGYSVSCPQLAGHCGSATDIKAAIWQDWYRSAEQALLEMRKACDSVIVGGLSTGAALALLLAARHPRDVHGTALFAPVLWRNGWLIPWYARLLDLVRTRRLAGLVRLPDVERLGIKDEVVREVLAGSPASGNPATSGSVLLQHRWLVQTVRKQLGSIHQPTLIVHPREDDYADLDNAAYLQRHLEGIVEMVVLDDCYHNVAVDRQRHIALERATTFVETVSKRARERVAKAQPKGMEEAPQTITVSAVPA